MPSAAKSGKTDRRERPGRGDRSLAGLEYHGVAGSSQDCQHAVMRLLQCGISIARARIISSGNTHCLLLTNAVGDPVAVKSGFSSGYGGNGLMDHSLIERLVPPGCRPEATSSENQ
jgi:hypothetical protein